MFGCQFVRGSGYMADLVSWNPQTMRNFMKLWDPFHSLSFSSIVNNSYGTNVCSTARAEKQITFKNTKKGAESSQSTIPPQLATNDSSKNPRIAITRRGSRNFSRGGGGGWRIYKKNLHFLSTFFSLTPKSL